MYQVILADPPWHYNHRKPYVSNNTRFGGGAYGRYDLMKTSELVELPVHKLADPTGCVLFLWATLPKLRDALDVIVGWGFTYKTVGFTWVKLNRKALTPFFGVGYYTKSNAEVCLLATRGPILKPATDCVSSLIQTPRLEHSKKPEEVQDRIGLLYPNARRIELFSTRPREGWDGTGLALDGRDIREFLEDNIG